MRPPGARTWNAAARDRVAAHLRGLGAYASGEAVRLDGELAAVADGWARSHRAACLASARGELTEALYERELACLERSRTALDATLDVLAHVPGDRLSDTIATARSLPEASRCRSEALSDTAPSPPPEHAAEVKLLAGELERIRVHAQAREPENRLRLTGTETDQPNEQYSAHCNLLPIDHHLTIARHRRQPPSARSLERSIDDRIARQRPCRRPRAAKSRGSARSRDAAPCTGAGTRGGVWTFAHLVREMANGSPTTPEDFATRWLSHWLNSYVVNGDTVVARTAMFTQVIRPWAAASGVTATLVTDKTTGHRSVNLTGPLDLNIAPFRLVAIVNRIDLGETTTAGSGTYGPITGSPSTPGELRFLFDVVQPSPWGAGTETSCGRKRFTTIFEYGVPGTGCASVVGWAQQWTSLLRFPGFTSDDLAQLQSMTESVVVHGAAPSKGNQNAINQIRTNEVALAAPWELREFTLTDENPSLGTDTPSSGVLRAHTVAQTPNDGMYRADGTDPAINDFVNLLHCNVPYTVPYFFEGRPFRGGNALVAPGTLGPGVGHWNANSITPWSPFDKICARHQFSMNTCHGCHQDDTGTNDPTTTPTSSTNFTHIDPLSPIPVRLSKFLTGAGPGTTFDVPDTQFPTDPSIPPWHFADLERRYENLFKLSHCTSCALRSIQDPHIVDVIAQLGPVPVDPNPPDPQLSFKVGPITDLAAVQQILQLRPQFAAGTTQEPVDFIQARSAAVE